MVLYTYKYLCIYHIIIVYYLVLSTKIVLVYLKFTKLLIYIISHQPMLLCTMYNIPSTPFLKEELLPVLLLWRVNKFVHVHEPRHSHVQ